MGEAGLMADLLDQIDALDLSGDQDSMEAFMREVYPLLFGAAYDEASADLPVAVSYDVTNPAIQGQIDKLAKRIRGVPDTVKENVRSVVGQALEGEYNEDLGRTVVPSNAEIAQRIRAAGVTDSEYRSRMIARTETATAMNLGHTFAYGDAGVSEVDVADGDDDGPCADANGQRWSLDDAQANPIEHPNCTRAFLPVLETMQPTGAQEPGAAEEEDTPQPIELSPDQQLLGAMDEMLSMGLAGQEDYNWVANQIATGGYTEHGLQQELAQIQKDLAKEYNKRAVIPTHITDLEGKFSEYSFQTAHGEQWRNWHDSLSDAEVSALRDYKQNGYTAINNQLRGLSEGTSDQVQSEIAQMDNAMAGQTLKQPAILWRGLSFGSSTPPPEFVSMRPGQVLHDEGFMSTTTHKSFSNNFGGQYLFQIYAPAGTNGVPMDSFAATNKTVEAEILLNRGTNLLIRKVETIDPDHYLVHAEVMP